MEHETIRNFTGFLMRENDLKTWDTPFGCHNFRMQKSQIWKTGFLLCWKMEFLRKKRFLSDIPPAHNSFQVFWKKLIRRLRNPFLFLGTQGHCQRTIKQKKGKMNSSGIKFKENRKNFILSTQTMILGGVMIYKEGSYLIISVEILLFDMMDIWDRARSINHTKNFHLFYNSANHFSYCLM